ncbi:MAG TPA: serine hydrolase domain-containing protein [Polyangiaceae bacterium]|nr:serine hydrolase domain-containing protein [Polyangiaceae bacterium]
MSARRANLFVSLSLGAVLAGCAGAPGARSAADATAPVAFEHGLRPGVLRAGQAPPGWSLRERMAHYGVPGVAVAVLRGGQVVHAAGYGVREAGTNDRVDADTLFSVASVSKVATAGVALRLVAKGALDLDRDVNAYLTSWQVPPREGARPPKVTLRMLMSHTAGFGQHGFKDFQPGEALPTALQTLDGQPPAKHEPVRLLHPPGERFGYSGGGVTVEQVVLGDVSGRPLEALARAELFGPLGMRRSTFENPLSAARGNIAKAHDHHGRPRARPRGWEAFAELAASGLWTSARELGAYVAALLRSYRGEGGFLPRALAVDMMTEVSPGGYGLGPRLSGWGETRVFSHSGSNESYKAYIEGNLSSGDGLVVLTNGARGADLYDEIRNAIADAYRWPTRRALRAIAADQRDPLAARYAGPYELDAGIPQDWQRALNDSPPELRIAWQGGALTCAWGAQPEPLELVPIAPNRFVTTDRRALQFEFHRDGGPPGALTVTSEDARLFYRRKAPAPP